MKAGQQRAVARNAILDPLQEALGHTFSDTALLELALTRRGVGRTNNERLEFLGDAVLDLVVSEELYRRHPAASESELTIARSHLVRRSSLARLAARLELGRYLRLGDSERHAGTHQRDSALADALEAVIGAVYLDAGIEAARTLVLELLDARLAAPPRGHEKDPKSQLQEWLQGKGRARPRYTVVAEEGPQHRREFLVAAVLDDALAAHGRAASRRAAEQRAAARLLVALAVGGSPDVGHTA